MKSGVEEQEYKEKKDVEVEEKETEKEIKQESGGRERKENSKKNE